MRPVNTWYWYFHHGGRHHVLAVKMDAITITVGTMIAQDICHNTCIPTDRLSSSDFSDDGRHFCRTVTLVLTDIKTVFSGFQLARVWPRPATATSGTMMEGGMQLLNRDGHSISHNSKRHYHDSFVSMNRMRQRGLLCDIVLHVSNKEIKAHKVVLASCSPYFHAMFTSKLSRSCPACLYIPPHVACLPFTLCSHLWMPMKPIMFMPPTLNCTYNCIVAHSLMTAQFVCAVSAPHPPSITVSFPFILSVAQVV